MIDYIERKVLGEVGNKKEEIRRGKDKKRRKLERRKPFIACVSRYWCMRALLVLRPHSASVSCVMSSAAISTRTAVDGMSDIS